MSPKVYSLMLFLEILSLITLDDVLSLSLRTQLVKARLNLLIRKREFVKRSAKSCNGICRIQVKRRRKRQQEEFGDADVGTAGDHQIINEHDFKNIGYFSKEQFEYRRFNNCVFDSECRKLKPGNVCHRSDKGYYCGDPKNRSADEQLEVPEQIFEESKEFFEKRHNVDFRPDDSCTSDEDCPTGMKCMLEVTAHYCDFRGGRPKAGHIGHLRLQDHDRQEIPSEFYWPVDKIDEEDNDWDRSAPDYV